jgi:prevent-host-death family protein
MQVDIAELKARLCEYLARVQAGAEVIVADRGRPVARIVPARGQQGATKTADFWIYNDEVFWGSGRVRCRSGSGH